MGQIVVGNYLEKTIPELEMIIRQHRWYFKLARKAKVPVNDPFFERICKQNNMATAAIVILKKQSKIHNLKQEVDSLLQEYSNKWGTDEENQIQD